MPSSVFRKVNKLFFCLISFYLNGRCATQHDFQTWFNVTVTGYFDRESKSFNRLTYWLENQERIGDDSSHFSQILFRPGIGYALTERTSLWVGYAWIKTGMPFTMHPFTEDRIWEQLLWIKKMERWSLLSRTRMEQRFMANNGKVAYRARQMLKIAIPFKNHSKFSFMSSDELFWHKNNFIGRNGQGFDQNRVFIGIGYQFNPNLITEVGYMNQYIRRFAVPNFLTNILSINFYANF